MKEQRCTVKEKKIMLKALEFIDDNKTTILIIRFYTFYIYITIKLLLPGKKKLCKLINFPEDYWDN